MTIALCYGTRPQVIKASRLARVLGERWDVLTIDTGQHDDDESNALLHEQLEVPPPRLSLGAGAAGRDTHTQVATILTRAAEAFARFAPRAVVVIGDANSTLGCALAAATMHIPVVHVEAGLRARDRRMSAEINRCVVDGLSDVLCASSRIAESRLRSEGVDGQVVCTGDVARDVLRASIARAIAPAAIEAWPLRAGEPFFLATLHRAELTGDAARLRTVLRALGDAPFPVVMPLHPATRERIRHFGLAGEGGPRLHLLPPLGYLEMLGCVREATAVVTDSGGLQREAYWLATPCVTLRRETEWTETVTLGANSLIPAEEAETRLPARLRQLAFGERRATWDRDAYGDGHAAGRIRDAVEACIGTMAGRVLTAARA